MLEYFPENVFADIMNFLNFKDFLVLTSTNKHIRDLMKSYEWILVRDCLSRYFSMDIELFCNFGDNLDLKENLRKQSSEIIKHSSPLHWRHFLRKESELRRQWFHLFLTYVSQEETLSFIDSIFFFLKEPSLPLMKLRRENVGMYAKSCFQNKLCDVLYEGSSISNTFYMLNDDVLGFLKAEKESFLNEFVDENKDQLKLYRWYSKENYQLSQKNEGFLQEEEEKEEPVFLLQLFEVLYDTLVFQMDLVSYILEMQNNPLDLLFHYNLKWNIYVASLSEYENVFASFVELFNNLYEKECKNYPSFPKFSIWRLMQKIWILKIFTPFEHKLLLSFLIILDYNRCLNLSKSLSQLDTDHDDNDRLAFINTLFHDHLITILTKYDIDFNNKHLNKLEDLANNSFKYADFNHDFFANENLEFLLNIAST